MTSHRSPQEVANSRTTDQRLRALFDALTDLVLVLSDIGEAFLEQVELENRVLTNQNREMREARR